MVIFRTDPAAWSPGGTLTAKFEISLIPVLAMSKFKEAVEAPRFAKRGTDPLMLVYSRTTLCALCHPAKAEISVMGLLAKLAVWSLEREAVPEISDIPRLPA